MKIIKLLICCVLFASPLSLYAQSWSGVHDSDTVKKFVQGFYDWYIPIAISSSGSAWSTATKHKRSFFGQELGRKLREDSEAQAKAEGEIVGLDFDPFLNTQDPGRHYIVGKVVAKGDSYMVEIHRVVSGKREEKLTLIAEVAGRNKQLYFVNFYYPNGYNLLAVLKALKVDREKPSGE